MTARVYPMLLPSFDDPRFSHGLIIDVATVLEAAGYPAVRGVDFVDLQGALFGFLYSDETPAEVDASRPAVTR